MNVHRHDRLLGQAAGKTPRSREFNDFLAGVKVYPGTVNASEGVRRKHHAYTTEQDNSGRPSKYSDIEKSAAGDTQQRLLALLHRPIVRTIYPRNIIL